MVDAILPVFMRYLHIVSAIAAVGGLIFAMACVKPALRVLDDGLRDSLLDVMRRRFLRIQNIAIAGLIISGVYNWMTLAAVYKKIGPMGNALIGTKVLLAAAMFAVVWARATGLMKSEKAAQMVNIHLAAIILLLAAILRYMRLQVG